MRSLLKKVATKYPVFWFEQLFDIDSRIPSDKDFDKLTNKLSHILDACMGFWGFGANSSARGDATQNTSCLDTSASVKGAAKLDLI